MSDVARTARVVVAGFGSRDRRDDGVGPFVAALVAERCGFVKDVGPLSDPLDLLGQWNDADLVVVIDAVRSGAPGGTLRVLEMDTGAASATRTSKEPTGVTSTHGIGLTGVVRLARAIDQCPKRLVVVGLEGERFDFGNGLSRAVLAAVPAAVDRVIDLVEEARTCV
jgi:hydrogenase maturation protease